MIAAEGAGARLWTLSFGIVLLAHGGLVAAMLGRTEPPAEGIPSEAIAVELWSEPSTTASLNEDAPGPPAEEAVAPSAEPDEASEPEPPAPDAAPPSEAEPTPQPPPEPVVDLPPPAPAEVVLPSTPEPKPAEPKPPEPPNPERVEKPVERQDAKAQNSVSSQARPAVTPAAAGGGRPSAARIATWRGELALRLQRHKRYPAEAQARRQQGVATVRFTLDAAGRVLTKALVKSSGVTVLDQESIAMVQRAQPFPTPPPNMPQPIEIVVPVQFSFRP